MEFIEESPFNFDVPAPEKAGTIRINKQNTLAIFWETERLWQYFPYTIAEEFKNLDSACDSLVKDAQKQSASISDLLHQLKSAKKELKDSQSALGTIQTELTRREKQIRREADIHQDLLTCYEGVKKEIRALKEQLIRAENAADTARQELAYSAVISAKAPRPSALDPEDVVGLRGHCTVDEILRMRDAGVL